MMSPASVRRQLFLGLGLAAISTPAFAAENAISHAAESIHQEPLFRASRKRIYDALTDARQFAKIVELSGAMQGAPPRTKAAEISGELGSAFTIFGCAHCGTTDRTRAQPANCSGMACGRLEPG
jgi:hypothetical protein